jgi:hypothetical protein
MIDWTEEKLEKFIRENKDKFEVMPRPGNEETFLLKLIKRIKHAIISIGPYLIKVGIVTFIVWGISILLWYFFDMPNLWGLFWKFIINF